MRAVGRGRSGNPRQDAPVLFSSLPKGRVRANCLDALRNLHRMRRLSSYRTSAHPLPDYGTYLPDLNCSDFGRGERGSAAGGNLARFPLGPIRRGSLSSLARTSGKPRLDFAGIMAVALVMDERVLLSQHAGGRVVPTRHVFRRRSAVRPRWGVFHRVASIHTLGYGVVLATARCLLFFFFWTWTSSLSRNMKVRSFWYVSNYCRGLLWKLAVKVH